MTPAGLRTWSRRLRALSAFTWCWSDKGPQNGWLFRIGKADSDKCRCGEVMTGIHVVEECPELEQSRWRPRGTEGREEVERDPRGTGKRRRHHRDLLARKKKEKRKKKGTKRRMCSRLSFITFNEFLTSTPVTLVIPITSITLLLLHLLFLFLLSVSPLLQATSYDQHRRFSVGRKNNK